MGTSDTQNFKLVLCYDGARFRGWQRGNGRTVQSTLEDALRRALPAASRGALGDHVAVATHGSGRTDAGVHAEGQVASVVLPAAVDPLLLLEAVNGELPSDLAVRSVQTVPERFHARYLAVAKTYRYRIIDGPSGNPLLRRFSWRVPKALDILVHGDGFLWKQVRIMVSALVAAAQAECDEHWLGRVLASGDRSLAPPAAPGLARIVPEILGHRVFTAAALGSQAIRASRDPASAYACRLWHGRSQSAKAVPRG